MAILKAECDAHLWLAKTLLHQGVLEGEDLAEVMAEVRRRLSVQRDIQRADVGSAEVSQ